MWWKVGLLSAILRIGVARIEIKIDKEQEMVEEEEEEETST